jgi:hypothetical protein
VLATRSGVRRSAAATAAAARSLPGTCAEPENLIERGTLPG